jgi:hypothetical protein
MSDVKRYKKHGEILGRVLVAAKDGDYVRYDDYAALRARLEAVEKGRDTWEIDARRNHEAAERAEAALATARRDAYERAAQVADKYDANISMGAGREIRALSNEAET